MCFKTVMECQRSRQVDLVANVWFKPRRAGAAIFCTINVLKSSEKYSPRDGISWPSPIPSLHSRGDSWASTVKISSKRMSKISGSVNVTFQQLQFLLYVFCFSMFFFPTPTLPWWLSNDLFFSENCQEAWSAKHELRESSDVLSAQPFQPKSDSREGFKFWTWKNLAVHP